jgi:hypothetical protein
MNNSLVKSIIKYINEMYNPIGIHFTENESYPNTINQFILLVEFDNLDNMSDNPFPITAFNSEVEGLKDELRCRIMKHIIREDVQTFFGINTTGFYLIDGLSMPPFREHELTIEVTVKN